jgi:hypothetical protein
VENPVVPGMERDRRPRIHVPTNDTRVNRPRISARHIHPIHLPGVTPPELQQLLDRFQALRGDLGAARAVLNRVGGSAGERAAMRQDAALYAEACAAGEPDPGAVNLDKRNRALAESTRVREGLLLSLEETEAAIVDLVTARAAEWRAANEPAVAKARAATAKASAEMAKASAELGRLQAFSNWLSDPWRPPRP